MDKQKGQLSLQVLIIGSVALFLISGFVLWTDSYVRGVSRGVDGSQAFTIAEAGIEYYRWHLAHDPEDFQDGTGEDGTYIHEYFDKDGVRIGVFELDITPPVSGSGIVTIRSTGRVDADPTAYRVIEARLAQPSLARYSVAANDDIRFGEGTEVYGRLHSNGGIRFDGVAYNLVTSAKETYNDPDHSGNSEFGVHTHVEPVDPSPSNPVPARTDIFKAGRSFPVPALDFDGLIQNLSTLQTLAEEDGYYRESSNDDGYHLVLKSNDKFDIYKVTKLVKAPKNCPASQSQWGTWSIDSETLLESNVDFPDNGIIFLEDDTWVEGVIDTARLTIAVGRFPEAPGQYKHIIVNDDLTYTNYDGQDVIALVAQGNFNVGLESEDDLRIDAAIIAQNGRAGRDYYDDDCGSGYQRDIITLYGMIISNQRYGFAYTDGTGYEDRVIMYDGNLLYGPPPNFPLTSTQFDILSWDEIK